MVELVALVRRGERSWVGHAAEHPLLPRHRGAEVIEEVQTCRGQATHAVMGVQRQVSQRVGNMRVRNHLLILIARGRGVPSTPASQNFAAKA